MEASVAMNGAPATELDLEPPTAGFSNGAWICMAYSYRRDAMVELMWLPERGSVGEHSAVSSFDELGQPVGMIVMLTAPGMPFQVAQEGVVTLESADYEPNGTVAGSFDVRITREDFDDTPEDESLVADVVGDFLCVNPDR